MREIACLLAVLIALPAAHKAAFAATPARDAAAESTALATPAPEFGSASLGTGIRCEVRFRGSAELVRALAANRGAALAAVAADVDRDGAADLVAGFATDAGNCIVVFRGLSGARFGRDARVTAVGSRPDRLAAGDFDADGYVDVAVATLGATRIDLLRGARSGQFAASESLDASGAVTAVMAADVGRRSGRSDLILAVDAADGPRIDVRASSAAWPAVSNSYPIAAPATSLDAADLGRAPELSIVAASGRSLVVLDRSGPARVDLSIAAAGLAVHRDRRGAPSIAVSDGVGSSVDVAVTRDGLVPGPAKAGAGGALVPLGLSGVVETGLAEGAAHWRAGVRTDARERLSAGVAMRVDRDAMPDLVAFEPGATTPTVFATEGSLPPVVVANTNDDGPGSLRQAILDAGAQNGGTITFAIPGAGPFVIALQSQLPDVLDPVTIDATTQAGYAGRPLVEIDGSATGDGAGLFLGADGCAVRGLSITRAFGSGITVVEAAGAVIEANFIGVDRFGSAKGNRQDGVTLTGATETVVGGTIASARNVISGNADIGVHSADGSHFNFILGNRIGTDPEGASAMPNGLDGINVEDAPLTTVGAPFGAGVNVVSGNGGVGVFVAGSASANCLVQGNRIGTDASGTSAIPNGADGVLLQGAPEGLVGGSAAGEGNLLSGNLLNGVALIGTGVEGSVVQGNLIGTDATGALAVANLGNGVYGEGAAGFLVGGAGAGEGNVISGNDSLGVGLFAGTTDARVHGNLIGPGRDGQQIGNFADGVYIQDSSDNLVGGVDDGEGNTIAYNGATGVFVYTGERNAIIRNAIFGNDWIGIDIGTPAVSPNDIGDGDGGSNTGINFPMTTDVASDASTTTVSGVYWGAPGQQFRLEYFSTPECDPFGYGEGRNFLGAFTITTNETGGAVFEATLPVATAAGSYVSATASDMLGNTSEFSECVLVMLAWDPPAVDGGPPVNLSLSAAGGRAGRVEGPRRADVTAYKIYLSSTQPVATTPANFFTSVPPSQTSVMAPASVGGYFAVTACYSDGSESGPSNDADSPGAPVISSVALKGTSKVVADGSNFTSGVLVIADGIPFVAPAKVKRAGTRVVQKGNLLTGQTVRQYLATRPVKPDGRRQVLLGFRNATGAVASFVVAQ